MKLSLVLSFLALTCAGWLESACLADSHGKFPGKGSQADFARAGAIGNKAMQLAESGNLQEAVMLEKQAISIYPYDSGRYHNLACDLYDLKRFDEAISAENKALALEPNFDGAWTKLGYCYEDSGRLDDAEKCYRRANALNCNTENCFSIADVLRQKKKYADARTWFLKAKSLSSQPSQITQINDRLLKLKPLLEASH